MRELRDGGPGSEATFPFQRHAGIGQAVVAGFGLVGKRLELLREVVPGLGRLAVLANVGFPGAVQEMGEVQAAAAKLDVEVILSEIRRADDIAPAFEALKGHAEALYVVSDTLVNTIRLRINTFALAAQPVR